MTPNQAREVLEFAHSFWPEDSKFRFFSRGEGAQLFGSSILGPKELANITDWTDNHGWSSYWQINPTRKATGTRCRTEDITHWAFLPLDIDPVTDRYHALGCFYEIEDHLQTLIPSLNPENRTIIDSGRGIQALYAMPPFALDDTLRRDIPQIMSRLFQNLGRKVGHCLGCVLDPACSDLPRVMRMPYTINPKTGIRASFVQKGRGVSVNAEAILSAIPAPPPRPAAKAPLAEHWIDFIPHLTVAARKFLEGGTPAPGRHKAATATMLRLLELGASQDQILSALRVGAVMCLPPLAYSEVESMVGRRF